MLVLEVERPTVDLAPLGRAQANTAPLAQAMSAYVAWARAADVDPSHDARRRLC